MAKTCGTCEHLQPSKLLSPWAWECAAPLPMWADDGDGAYQQPDEDATHCAAYRECAKEAI